jgi:hypothetical protein
MREPNWSQGVSEISGREAIAIATLMELGFSSGSPESSILATLEFSTLHFSTLHFSKLQFSGLQF